MAFTFSIKDTYRQAVEAASGGKQTVLYDDKGYPSIMNIIPKLSYKDVGLSDSTKALPAFMVDDAEKPEIFVGTFMAMVHDGRACSLPGQVPKVYTNMDQAIAYCRAKGPGWHCMTNAEYAAIALWCKANGYYPRGNNNYGSDHGYPHEKCRPGTVGSDGRINLGLTGSGPNSWTHDGTPNGIYGLNGDGWEWAIGLRTNNGEIQILTGNNAAKNTADLTAGSAEWKAKINWKVRIKNKAFWLALIPAVLLLIQVIASVFGYTLDLGDLGNKLLSVVEALFMVLSILGIVVDPTTDGVGDSKQALTYTEPKK